MADPTRQGVMYMKLTEAMRFDGTDAGGNAIDAWMQQHGARVASREWDGETPVLVTSQGEKCREGDWLILNMRGYYHTIENELFSGTYKQVRQDNDECACGNPLGADSCLDQADQFR